MTLFHDGAAYWLVDGFHRYHAHLKAKKVAIDAIAKPGTKRDAILFAVGTNHDHGLRRSNEDKRKAVGTLLSDAEWSIWSDRAIAEACFVGHAMVSNMRASLSTKHSEESKPERTYITKHGTEAVMKTGKIGKKKADPPKAKPRRPKAQSVIPDGPTRKDLLDEQETEIRALQSQVEALTVPDQAKELQKQMSLLRHAVREKDEEMDKNARLLQQRDTLQRFQSEVVTATGTKDPKAALAWIREKRK